MFSKQVEQLDPGHRKAAIFLSSLAEDAAEKMLQSLPQSDAEAIRRALELLDDIDLEKQRDVAAEFRRDKDTASTAVPSGVELDASLLARMEQHESVPMAPEPETRWNSLTTEEAAKVVEVISQERPQTVAIVMSRLEPQVAATILPRLSSELQDEVLRCLADLDPADELSVQVVESHLTEWINRHRQKKQRLAAGVDLVQQILENTNSGDRQVISARLNRTQPQLATALKQPTSIPTIASSEPATPEDRLTSRNTVAVQRKRFLPQIPPTPKPAVDTFEIADPLGELAKLDDQTLLTALASADRKIVMLALAGADDALMSRVLKRLPRSQAEKYRTQLRNIGPTRLSDMAEAQRQLARFAMQVSRDQSAGS